LLREDGAPPTVDLTAERKNGDFVRAQILSGNVSACHDISDGGLLIAIAEMALAGNTGATLTPLESHAFWFGEDQARYVLAVSNAPALLAAAATAGIPAQPIGHTGGNSLTLAGSIAIFLDMLRDANESFFPAWFA
jgi:phosphoribosylformylglycinamidine synthase